MRFDYHGEATSLVTQLRAERAHASAAEFAQALGQSGTSRELLMRVRWCAKGLLQSGAGSPGARERAHRLFVAISNELDMDASDQLVRPRAALA